MAKFLNEIISSTIFVDPYPLPAKSAFKASMTILGIILTPCGLPGKVLGRVAKHVGCCNIKEIKIKHLQIKTTKKKPIISIERQPIGRTESQTGLYRKSWQSNEYVYGARLKNRQYVDVPRKTILKQTGRERITEILLSELTGFAAPKPSGFGAVFI